MQPPGSDHIRAFHLADHRRDAAVTQAILHHGQHVLVLPHLDEQQRRRIEPRLFETRRIEIEAAQHPQDAPSRCRGGPHGDPHREQRCRSIVAERRRRRCDLVKAAERQAAIRQPVIERVDPER
ncbi:hypothetical protein [Sphingomonas sp. S-NIH.Pt15_0812]|uniref:hypothetical protein n=1 Tax=Sphingomonas sp. S-NIH.Pt15_0812 TaxID=1920129 RepID=UPI0013DFA980|nr:hypothetical protein [Sphingomonas sp. S-NIH.Pt15_0812]